MGKCTAEGVELFKITNYDYPDDDETLHYGSSMRVELYPIRGWFVIKGAGIFYDTQSFNINRFVDCLDGDCVVDFLKGESGYEPITENWVWNGFTKVFFKAERLTYLTVRGADRE